MNVGKQPTVFVTRPAPPDGLNRLRQHCNVIVHESEANITKEQLIKALPGVDAVFVHPPAPINKETLDVAGPQLKVVGCMSVGLDHIDLEECKRRGVKVGYTPEVLTTAVAEMAVALTLATARCLGEGLQAVKNGEWAFSWRSGLWLAGKQVKGSVVGIVGLGRIGLATAKRLAAFEPERILYCGNSVKPTAEAINAEFVSFHELLEMSDFVIATCAITEKSRGMFGKDAFKRMKNSAVFINITRGALVDQEALYEALTTNQIGAAGIDVTTPEPLPTSHKLLSLPNCLVTPHIGSATLVARNAMCELTVDNILAGLNNQPLPSPAV